MPTTGIPDPNKVRHLLTDKTVPPEELNRHGDAFLEAGHPSDAVMFYERTRSADRIKKVIDLAQKEGDAFLLEWAARLAPDDVTAEVWARTGDRATELKKLAFARAAYSKAGDLVKASQANEAYLRMML